MSSGMMRIKHPPSQPSPARGEGDIFANTADNFHHESSFPPGGGRLGWGIKPTGFTLIEILVALFIFTIVAVIMTHALHTIFASQTVTDQRAERLADLQTTMLLISRDLEQSVNRTVTDNQGTRIAPFIGATQSVQFTHGGNANPQGQMQRSTLQRTEYALEQGFLIRRTWPALDQTKETQSDQRKLIGDITDLHFAYFDATGTAFKRWPPAEQKTQAVALPRAVQITFIIKKWGRISQLYLIPGQTIGTR